MHMCIYLVFLYLQQNNINIVYGLSGLHCGTRRSSVCLLVFFLQKMKNAQFLGLNGTADLLSSYYLMGYFHKFFDFVAIHEIVQLSRAEWKLDILNKMFYIEKA